MRTSSNLKMLLKLLFAAFCVLSSVITNEDGTKMEKASLTFAGTDVIPNTIKEAIVNNKTLNSTKTLFSASKIINLFEKIAEANNMRFERICMLCDQYRLVVPQPVNNLTMMHQDKITIRDIIAAELDSENEVTPQRNIGTYEVLMIWVAGLVVLMPVIILLFLFIVAVIRTKECK